MNLNNSDEKILDATILFHINQSNINKQILVTKVRDVDKKSR